MIPSLRLLLPRRYHKAVAVNGGWCLLARVDGLVRSAYWRRAAGPWGRVPERGTCLKIMVSPVRIRVPSLLKVPQIVRKRWLIPNHLRTQGRQFDDNWIPETPSCEPSLLDRVGC